MYSPEWYSGRIDRRVLLALADSGASMHNLCARVGINERHARGLVTGLVIAGFAYRWTAGKITIVNLTSKGKRYASELRQSLTPNELERLLTPRKGNKRAATKPNKPNSLGNSLGL